MAPQRNPINGQLLPGHSANPSGRPGKRAYRKFLQTLIGEFGEEAYRTIDEVRRGECSFEKLVREPHAWEDSASAALIPKVKVVPSIRERMDAAQMLVEHLNGKPAVEIAVEHDHLVQVRNYDALSDRELEALEATLAKAELPAGDIVEGECVPSEQSQDE